MAVGTLDESIEWLMRQDREMCVLIAARAAARVWPLVTRELAPFDQVRQNALVSGRAILTSGVACKMLTSEIKKAASAASASAALVSSRADSASLVAASDAVNVAIVTNFALVAADALVSSSIAADVTIDSTILFDSNRDFHDLLSCSIWNPRPQSTWLQAATDSNTDVLDEGPEWSFWRRWYDGWLTGNHVEWDLQYRIATEIKEDVWEAGVEEVALAILNIERDFRTGIGPRLKRNDAGLWDVEDDVDIDEEPVDFAIGQVEVALEAALASAQGNGIKESSNETLLCRKAFEKRENPSVVATQFWNACMGMQKGIDEGWYPDDAAHLGLKNTLYTSVQELCEQDELIRDRIGKLADLSPLRDATRDELEDLRQVPDAMRGEMTDVAQKELEEAVEIVTTTEKPPRMYRARLVNWLNTLGQGVDQGMKQEKRANWLMKLASRIAGWFFREDSEDGPPEDGGEG